LQSLLIRTPLLGFSTIGFGLVSLLVSMVDATGRRQHAIARHWARSLERLCGIRVEMFGRENLIVAKPCVYVANHSSYMDIPVIFGELPLQFRILARKGLFSIPFLGWHLRRSRHLPVDRETPAAALVSLKGAAEAVRQGLPVFIFPEGGRSLSGDLDPFLAGAFFVAIRAQVPVLPIVLEGMRQVLPPGSIHLRPAHVRIAVLPPIETVGMQVRESEKLADFVRRQMLEVQARLRTRSPVDLSPHVSAPPEHRTPEAEP
jgi:1-acyl-sn-glycerol-3-phosphate acyltransferase